LIPNLCTHRPVQYSETTQWTYFELLILKLFYVVDVVETEC